MIKVEQNRRTSGPWRLQVWIWLVSVSGLSLAPFDLKNRIYTTGSLHNLGHFGVFAVTACLLASSRTTFRGRAAAGFSAWLLGLALELAQWIIYKNRFERWDLWVNASGVLVGVWFMHAMTLLCPPANRHVQS